MTQPTVPTHWRKAVSRRNQTSIPLWQPRLYKTARIARGILAPFPLDAGDQIWAPMSTVLLDDNRLTYALSLAVEHKAQTTHLHAALSCAAVSIFRQLNSKWCIPVHRLLDDDSECYDLVTEETCLFFLVVCCLMLPFSLSNMILLRQPLNEETRLRNTTSCSSTYPRKRIKAKQ